MSIQPAKSSGPQITWAANDKKSNPEVLNHLLQGRKEKKRKPQPTKQWKRCGCGRLSCLNTGLCACVEAVALQKPTLGQETERTKREKQKLLALVPTTPTYGRRTCTLRAKLTTMQIKREGMAQIKPHNTTTASKEGKPTGSETIESRNTRVTTVVKKWSEEKQPTKVTSSHPSSQVLPQTPFVVLKQPTHRKVPIQWNETYNGTDMNSSSQQAMETTFTTLESHQSHRHLPRS